MTWMHYLVEANLYMAAFYALYLIFLRGETHYQLNRAYLLSTSLLAFLIPFVQLGILKPAVKASTQISVGDLSGYAVALAPHPVYSAPKWTIDDYILLAYALVAIVLFISLCIRVFLLMALLKKGSVTKSSDYNIIELHQGSVAFSFFNNLFIDDRLASSQTILHHEQVHIRQKHSWDIIYLEFVKIINWFNPVVYLLIASIKEVHEFIADEQTANMQNDNDSYTDFLISNAYGITQHSLTNSFFNKNLLKRRITMLYQKKSGKAARLKYLLALPLICGLLCLSTLAFTTKTYGYIDVLPKNHQFLQPKMVNNPLSYINASDHSVKHNMQPLNNQKKYLPNTTAPITNKKTALSNSDSSEDYAKGYRDAMLEHQKNMANTTQSVAGNSQQTSNDTVYKVAEVLPQFPGGIAGLNQFVKTNVRYPAEDHDKNIQGKAYIQFVVEKDGSLDNFRVLRAPSEAMGKEAVRVLASSPKWKPAMQGDKTVRVQFTMPINFALSNDGPNAPFNISTQAQRPVNEVEANSNTVYTAVEIQPEFPGGEAGLTKFLQQTIRYPATAKQNRIQGKVYVQFVVEKDGSLTDIKIIREPGSGTGDEAVRVMKLSPKWSPGTQNGKPVRVQFTLPINFALGT